MIRRVFLIGSALVFLLFWGGAAFAGPYSVTGVTPDVAQAWATSVVGSQNQGTATNILGAVNGSWAIGKPGGGWITVGFDKAITNGTGADFAVWENGFLVSGTSLVYAELGYVDVSTDGTNWVTFPSVYLDAQSGSPNIDPTNVYNLAGNYVANYVSNSLRQGTPFNLDDILNAPEVLTGLVDPYEINYVRLRDIIGGGEGGYNIDQATYFGYGANNLIYDGASYGGGADWDAIGVINQASPVPVPGGVLLLGSGFLRLIVFRRRRAD